MLTIFLCMDVVLNPSVFLSKKKKKQQRTGGSWGRLITKHTLLSTVYSRAAIKMHSHCQLRGLCYAPPDLLLKGSCCHNSIPSTQAEDSFQKQVNSFTDLCRQKHNLKKKSHLTLFEHGLCNCETPAHNVYLMGPRMRFSDVWLEKPNQESNNFNIIIAATTKVMPCLHKRNYSSIVVSLRLFNASLINGLCLAWAGRQ